MIKSMMTLAGIGVCFRVCGGEGEGGGEGRARA